jgi:tRNA(Ile)-lysidine synthase
LMLEEILRDQCELELNRPVLAGVSGGPDSLCLLDVLCTAGYRVIVAHFNHKLRPEADREAEAVAERAQTLGLDFVTDSADVGGYALSKGLSLEEAARLLRYRFLFAAAKKQPAQAVAVGHTADDQAETVLMHFLRGAGLNGLKGMEYRSFLPVFDPDIPLVRPLLSLWRADTEAYCREHALSPHFDPTNADQAYFRNRLRHSLIPELETYNPRFKEALLHSAAALQGDAAVLQEMIDSAWKLVVLGNGAGWYAFDRAKLTGFSVGLRRNLLRRAAELLRPESRDIGFAALQRASAFAEAPAGKQVDFINGLSLSVDGERLFLSAYEADLPLAHWPQVSGELTLKYPGSVELGEGWRLSVDELEAEDALEQAQEHANPYQAWLDAESILSTLIGGGNQLMIRNSPPGERFQPLGMDGHSLKLSDFFVNVKLPRRARRGWPIVYARDVPIWVPGYRLAHPFRITERTKRVVRLVLHKK